MTGFVEFDDPRLARAPLPADLGALETQAAITVLTNRLRTIEHPVISAPCLGIGLQILAAKVQMTSVCLLNPRVVAAENIAWNRGEQFPLTGPLRRDVLRAGRITLEGLRENGQPAVLTCEGAFAVMVQQQMELLSNHLPIHWMTRFDRALLARGGAPAMRHFLHRLVEFLYRPVDPAHPAQGTTVKRPEGADVLALDALTGNGTPRTLARLHRRDPLVPLSSASRNLLCLALGATNGHVLVVGAGLLDLTLGLRHALPKSNIELMAPEGTLPESLLHEMGVLPHPLFSLRSGRFADIEKSIGRSAVELILCAADQPPELLGFRPTDVDDLRRLSRVCQGQGGLCVLTARHRREDLEYALKAVFVHVECHEDSAQGVVYLAAKKPIPRDQIRARAFAAAQQHDMAEIAEVLAARAVVLSKDGKERA